MASAIHSGRRPAELPQGVQHGGDLALQVSSDGGRALRPRALVGGGQRHGWALRYRKGRSFLTLVPERGRALAVIVLCREERVAAEAVLPRLGRATRDAYREAATFADGKWLAVPLDGKQAVSDVMAILSLKRNGTSARSEAP